MAELPKEVEQAMKSLVGIVAKSQRAQKQADEWKTRALNAEAKLRAIASALADKVRKLSNGDDRRIASNRKRVPWQHRPENEAKVAKWKDSVRASHKKKPWQERPENAEKAKQWRANLSASMKKYRAEHVQ